MGESIAFQEKAINLYKSMEKYSNTEFLAQLLITLSELQEKINAMSEAVDSLKQAKQIYEDHYTVVDKRTCKVKRNISLLYIRMEKYQEALTELNEVLVSV